MKKFKFKNGFVMCRQPQYSFSVCCFSQRFSTADSGMSGLI
jgi:hypothetical protein